MKTLLLVFVSFFLLIGCESNKTTEPETGMGMLEMYMTVWNAYGEDFGKVANIPANPKQVYTTELINIRHLIPEIQVTTDEIEAGVAANSVDWITIYQSDEEMLHTDREVSIEIPTGDYRGIRIVQRNLMYWVCTNDGDVIEFPSLNDNELAPEELLVNTFGEEGLYEIDGEGNFYLYHDGEKLGTFEILPGSNTKVTMRLNIQTIDWHDNDGSGDWSYGDELSNWTLPEGIETMSDFIVEYY
jgi:hypothetical protein